MPECHTVSMLDLPTRLNASRGPGVNNTSYFFPQGRVGHKLLRSRMGVETLVWSTPVFGA